MLRIDLTRPENIDQKQMLALKVILSNSDKSFFKKNRPYLTYVKDQQLEVTLNRSIVTYQRNPSGKHAGECLHAILSNKKLGAGSYGIVRLSKYSIHLQPDCVIDKKPHAIKFLTSKKRAGNEALFSPDHHRVKPPTTVKPGKYAVVMKHFNGQTLKKLLDTDRTLPASKKMDARRRLALCLTVAETIRNDIHLRNIVHRDLKPQNIMVKYKKKSSAFHINIIDFEHAKYNSTQDKKSFGSPIYSSPESYQPDILFKGLPTDKTKELAQDLIFNTTEQSDIYSLACIITEILGCNRETIFTQITDLFDERISQRIFIDNFCENFPEANLLPFPKLCLLIRDMTKKLPEQRDTLDNIIKRLHDINETLAFISKLTQYITPENQPLRRHSKSMSSLFLHKNTHRGIHFKHAQQLLNLSHGIKEHGYQPVKEFMCEKFKNIVSEHQDLISSHLNADHPGRPLDCSIKSI